MTRSFALVALVSLAARAQQPPAAEPKQKVVLMPFATLSGDVAPRMGPKAAGMLSTELKNSEKFELLEAPKSSAEAAGVEALAAAKAAVDEATVLRAKKKFRLADEALRKALSTWRGVASQVNEVGEVVDATALLSAVQFNTGRDDEGSKSLNAALALAPDRDLPLAQTSALFSKVVADARKALHDGPKGTLTVESSPSNATFTLDGITLGTTPLLVKEVPPGQHYWHAQLPNGELVGGTLEVSASKPSTLRAVSQNKDADSRLLSALAQNRLDGEAVAAAKEVAKTAEADVVVFGALSHEGKGLVLDAFELVAATGEVRRLPRASFDTELLSAGMEFFNVAGDLVKKGAQAGEAVKVPSVVSMGVVVASKQSEVRYGQAPGRDLAAEALESEAAGKEEPRKPLEQRRVPLKKK